jgi:8-oxo-dGTP pyrophosphatase MutT (NUDIX family)
MSSIHYSAGGVVIGPGNKIIVVSQNGNSWSLPKGHLEPGEDDEEAAIREIFEESGIQDVRILEKLGAYDRGRIGVDGIGENLEQMKHITIFLCITNQEELKPIDPENPFAEWVAIQDVADKLTHPKDKDFFHSVTPKILKHLAS